jgi:hypothetical protein
MSTFSDAKGPRLRAQTHAKSASVKLCCFREVTVTAGKRSNGPCGDVKSCTMSVLGLQGRSVFGRYRHRSNRSNHVNRKDIGVDRVRMGTVVNRVTRCPTVWIGSEWGLL